LSKGSTRRPGKGYDLNYDKIFKKGVKDVVQKKKVPKVQRTRNFVAKHARQSVQGGPHTDRKRDASHRRHLHKGGSGYNETP
jgi:hypothetical protein